MWQDLYDEYDLCEPVRKAPRKRKVDASTAADPAAPCPAAAPCAAAAAPSASLPAAPAAVAVAVAAPLVQAVAVPVCSAGSAPVTLQHSDVGAPMVTANEATMPAAAGHCSAGVTEIIGGLPAAAAGGVASQAANGQVAGMAGGCTQGLPPTAAHGAVCGAAASVAAGGDGAATAMATAPAARAAPAANGHTSLHMPAQAAPVLAATAASSLASAPDAATLAGVAALFGASIGGTALARPPPGGNPALGQVNSALVQGLPAATALAARAGDTAVAVGALGAVPEGCPGAVQPPAPKRRGRPPGSGKKQKAEGEGGPAKPRAPRAPRDPGQNFNAGDIAMVAAIPADAAAAGAAGASLGENPSTANVTSGRPARRAASFSVNYAAAGGEPGMERVMYDDGFDRLLGCTKCRYLKNGCGTVSHPTRLGGCLASDACWRERGPPHFTEVVA